MEIKSRTLDVESIIDYYNWYIVRIPTSRVTHSRIEAHTDCRYILGIF